MFFPASALPLMRVRERLLADFWEKNTEGGEMQHTGR